MEDITPVELERIAVLMEEAAEVVHICTKIIRNGWHAKNPLVKNSLNNQQLLTGEIGDLKAAIKIVEAAGDVSFAETQIAMVHKFYRVQKFLHRPINKRWAQTLYEEART